jgi:iron(III) transport system permease protein
MSWLFYYSLVDRSGAFTLDNFKTLVTDPVFVDPMITTLILATSSSIICCAFAAPMGWLVARTDMPLRRTVRALVTASFVTRRRSSAPSRGSCWRRPTAVSSTRSTAP